MTVLPDTTLILYLLLLLLTCPLISTSITTSRYFFHRLVHLSPKPHFLVSFVTFYLWRISTKYDVLKFFFLKKLFSINSLRQLNTLLFISSSVITLEPFLTLVLPAFTVLEPCPVFVCIFPLFTRLLTHG